MTELNYKELSQEYMDDEFLDVELFQKVKDLLIQEMPGVLVVETGDLNKIHSHKNYARLRLDFELFEQPEDNWLDGAPLSDNSRYLFALQIVTDLKDLILNGDKGLSDHLLVALDGLGKLGPGYPKLTIYNKIYTYSHFSPRKNRTEYTTYFLITLETVDE